jgi:dihydroflavonol-4-reductase
VTGATGFLGRAVCRYLTQHGYAARALARPTAETAFLENLGVSIAYGDVTDPASVGQAVAGCEFVVHAAAHFRLWGPPEPFWCTNVEGARHVLEAALAAGVKRLVHVSTIIVVGPQPRRAVITEETPCRPHPTDHYALSKKAGEELALSYTGRGLPVIALRLGALYGPHGHYGFNRLFFEEFLRHWRVQVHGGHRIIFPCFVDDAAWAIEAALRRGRAGQVYNVSGQSIAHREANRLVSRITGRSNWRVNIPGWLMINVARLLEAAARVTGREPYYPLNLAPYVFCDWVVNSSKAARDLGFAPIPFEEGARRTLAWYRSVGYW